MLPTDKRVVVMFDHKVADNRTGHVTNKVAFCYRCYMEKHNDAVECGFKLH